MSTNGKPETGPEPDEARRERGEQTTETAETLPSGRRVIGGYRIVRKLGEGGMAIVYEAEQQTPRRPVALKVVRGGRHISQHDVKLFQREVQALARLKHPGIGAIYEAGRTDDGQHFFAMELVRGERLTDYVQRKKPPMRERLELFRRICEAINYAHQRGVIHRDLKPSNILIDAEGNPKVLDFGLARITESDISVTTVATEIARIQGTLPYMSPEQARGNPDEIDLRSDAYSLGVILYELLTGELPYDVTGAMLHEAVRIICEEPPRRPSTLNRTLRGDVETIALKALEKEPSRRYQSASALADDVERYLTDQPILARPPSAIYQFRKLVARHKAPFAFVAALFVLVAGFGIWMSVLYARAEQLRVAAVAAEQQQSRERQRAEIARHEAEGEAQKAGQIQGVLQDMLGAVDPFDEDAIRPDVTVRESLDEAARRVETELADQPEVQAAVQHTIGRSYLGLGAYAKAERHLREALTNRRRLFGDEHADVATSLKLLAEILAKQGKYDQAELLTREALAIYRKVHGNEHPDVARSLDQLGSVLYQGVGGREAREALWREALTLSRAWSGDELWVAHDAILSGLLLGDEGDYAGAEPLHREALAIYRRIRGDEHPDVAVSLSNLAWTVFRQGKYDEAEQLYRQALAIRRKALGGEHPDVAGTLHSLAWLLTDRGKFDEGQAMFREALAMRRKLLGDEHPAVARSLQSLARVVAHFGKENEAEAMAREALAIRRKVLGDEHLDVATSLDNLTYVLAMQGKFDEAERTAREALAIYRKVHGDDDPAMGWTLMQLGMIVARPGRYEEATALVREALAIHRKLLGNEDPVVAWDLLALGALLYMKGDYAAAEAMAREALTIQRKVFGNEHWTVAQSLMFLGVLLCARGDCGAADPLFREALAIRRNVVGQEHAKLAPGVNYMVWLLRAKGDYGAAERLARHGLVAAREVHGDEHPDVASILSSLAWTVFRQGKYDEAEALFREALAMRRKLLGDEHPDVAESLNSLANVLRAKGDHAAAEPLRREYLNWRLERDSGDGDAMAGMAELCLDADDPLIRDPGRALELAERAVALAPDYGPYRRVLGRVYLALGRHGDAADEFERALEAAGENEWDLLLLAMARLRAGQVTEAREALASADELIAEIDDEEDPELAELHASVSQAILQDGREP